MALWADLVSKFPCPDVVCLFICDIAKNPLPGLLDKERIANVGFFPFNDNSGFEKNWVVGSLQTSLPCTMGELAGSVAVGVGFSDGWELAVDR